MAAAAPTTATNAIVVSIIDEKPLPLELGLASLSSAVAELRVSRIASDDDSGDAAAADADATSMSTKIVRVRVLAMLLFENLNELVAVMTRILWYESPRLSQG